MTGEDALTGATIGIQVSGRFATVDDLLADARSRLNRVDVAGMRAIVAAGGGVVDIRPAWVRAVDGELEGSVIVERNHLEWRLHPSSGVHLRGAESIARWVVVCSEGYTSSLAADALRSLGLDATDLIGGIRAWRESGGELLPSLTPADTIVVAGRHVASSDHLSQLGRPDLESEPAN
jgi:rhodanese-related sulfurtransferase